MQQFIRKSLSNIKLSIVKTYSTIEWLLYFILKTDRKNHIPRVSNSRSLLILANGPSLKEDIGGIDYSGCDISVLNDFYKSSWYQKIKPQYYVLADPMFFTDEGFFHSFVKEVNWKMVLFVPYYYWKRIKILRDNSSKYVEIIPYNSEPYDGFEFLKTYLYKKGLSMPRVQNVLVASLFTGLNMGYKEIRLYGVDHSWTKSLGVNNENDVCAIDTHFYDKEECSFSPYWKNPQKKETYKMHELLRDFAYMFESYHVIRSYADMLGARIINFTKDSFIDAFERA